VSWKPNFSIENKLWKKGLNLVCGLDEVGRGSFAGPVVTGAVVYEREYKVRDKIVDKLGRKVVIRDSKKMSARQRGIAADWIAKSALGYAVGESGVDEINKKGILNATSSAFRRSVVNLNNRLKTRVEYLLIDAFFIPYTREYPVGPVEDNMGYRQAAIPSGDTISFSIASASIIAKVYRDELMKSLSRSDKKYKVYAWHSNKGYGTKWHREALKNHGPCKYHRTDFVRNYVS
jgi:ribonuclease HII